MRSLLAAATLSIMFHAGTAPAFEVTICKQTVPGGEVATLMNDLFCDDNGGPNVTLNGGSTLLMNGHVIDGGYLGVATNPGAPVRIIGPGEITGADGNPSFGAISASGKVFIDTVWLHDNANGIVLIYDFPARLSNVTITDNDGDGIRSYFGALGSGGGPGTGAINGRYVTIAGNGGDGVAAIGMLKLRDTGINENGGAGIRSRGKRFFLHDVNVTNNVAGGIVSTSTKPGRLKESTATGNGPVGDIAAPVAPKLKLSTCEHSVDTDSGGTLGICTGD